MALRPTPALLPAPPDLPNMPEVSNTLTQYLRTFALWCRNGFQDRLPANQALPGILLRATDSPAVYLITVNSTGAITVTAQVLGSGQP